MASKISRFLASNFKLEKKRLSAVFLVFVLFFLLGTVFAQESTGLFYVARSGANVREDGNMSAKVIGQVNKGDRLEFIEENNNWLKFKLPDGSMGWVYKSLVSPVQWGIEANLFYGNHLFYQGDIDGAIKQYRLAIVKKTEDWRAQYNLANAYLKKQMFPEAIKEYESLNEKWPDKFNSYFNLGLAYYYMSDWEKATKAWERAATISPNSLQVYYNLALTFEKFDQKEAINYWKKYLELASQHPEIKNTQEVLERIKTLSGTSN